MYIVLIFRVFKSAIFWFISWILPTHDLISVPISVVPFPCFSVLKQYNMTLSISIASLLLRIRTRDQSSTNNICIDKPFVRNHRWANSTYVWRCFVSSCHRKKNHNKTKIQSKTYIQMNFLSCRLMQCILLKITPVGISRYLILPVLH